MQTRWWLWGYDESAIFQPIKLFFHLSSHLWVEQTLHIHNLFKRHSPQESISVHISYADSWSLNSNAGNFLYKSDACDKLIWQTLWVTNAYNCHHLEKDLINGVLFQVQLQEPSCLCLPILQSLCRHWPWMDIKRQTIACQPHSDTWLATVETLVQERRGREYRLAFQHSIINTEF